MRVPAQFLLGLFAADLLVEDQSVGKSVQRFARFLERPRLCFSFCSAADTRGFTYAALLEYHDRNYVVRFAEALPKTRSGKIMRRLLKEIASGAKVSGDTTTLEDFGVLAKLAEPEE